MRTIAKFLFLVAALASLAGCTVYKAAMDERSLGQIYDDEQITFLIDKELLADKDVNYMDYKAFTYLGRVYLVGEYESDTQRNRAIRLARDVEGVRSVTTYLLPKQEVANCGTSDQLRIAAELDKDLLEDESVNGTNVDTKIVQCQAVLLGLVGSQQEIDRAQAIAGQVPGVTAVKSFLHVYTDR
ncbi:BON domain-containing protein [Paucidesulfovibrio longus]|uniref:BON domain-containing protein n=1 Tax=Paucidesulfovibrio longus TaxID=889 RepID=UPI0003B7AD13|nr:BON domain-containing protein [Paucidesulfovibrio longus]